MSAAAIPATPASSAPRKRSPMPSALITALLLIVIFYFGKPVLMPLALSALFAFLLSPIVNYLHRWRLPRAVAVLIVTLFVFSLLGVIGWVIGREFSALATSLPNYKDNITQRVFSFYSSSRGGVMEKLQDLKTTIKATSEAAAKEVAPEMGPDGKPAPGTPGQCLL